VSLILWCVDDFFSYIIPSHPWFFLLYRTEVRAIRRIGPGEISFTWRHQQITGSTFTFLKITWMCNIYFLVS
jgi:hypothetical protein